MTEPSDMPPLSWLRRARANSVPRPGGRWLAALAFAAGLACPLWPLLSPDRSEGTSAAEGFDRAAFSRQAETLPAAARLLAQAYLDDIDKLAREDAHGRRAAQFAATELASRFGYATDMEIWGVEDYWASPLEFIGKGRGDCEDFAIAAFYMLSSAGIPKPSMRLAYARLNIGSETLPHMVLLLDDGEGGWWTIDNTQPSVERAAERLDLAILFTFDESHVYVGSGSVLAGDAPSHIGQWRDALDKSRREGFR